MLPPTLERNNAKLLRKPPTAITRRRILRRLRRLLTISLCAFGSLLLLISLYREVSAVPLPPLPFAYHFIPSPNIDDRPNAEDVSCVVLHSTVIATTEDTVRVFLDTKTQVSAHFVVGRDGQVIQMVPVEKRAWHAGESVLKGRPRVNEYSVGIEMVNLNDGIDPYPDAQVHAVAGIIRFLRSRYEIPDSRIVSHAQIALPAGRKSDPTNFDFARLFQLLKRDEG